MANPETKKRSPWWTYHIANGLSLLRALHAVPVLLFSAWAAFVDPAMWGWAFGALAYGWLTDTVDGWAARKWGSPTQAWAEHIKNGGSRKGFLAETWTTSRLINLSFRMSMYDPDGAADTILAFTSSLVPVVYMVFTTQNKWAMMLVTLLVLAYIFSILSGLLMMKFLGKDPEFKNLGTRGWVGFNMLVFHGAFQIGFTLLWFAYMAGGWGLTILVAAVLAFVASRQGDKMRLWLSGRLTPRTTQP